MSSSHSSTIGAYDSLPGNRLGPVGGIPRDWVVKSLVDLAEVRSGIAKNSKREVKTPVVVPYLRVANVQDGYLDLSEMSTIRVSRGDLLRYAVLNGDVLMNEGGDLDKLGRGAMWHGEFSPCVHQNHVFVVRCASPLLPEYLNVWTAAAPARRFFLVAGKQTTNLASINKTALGQLPVALPPLPEQRAIAEALSDVDGLLGALEALIAKKRAIKQAAMQQLLSGKTRLPGFSGEWVTNRLREVADVDPENLGSSTNPDFAFNYISLEQVDDGRLLSHSEEVFGTAPSRARRVLRRGDVLMSTVRPNLMAHLFYCEQVPNAVCSTGFAVLRAKRSGSDAGFLFAHLFGHVVNKQIEKTLAGSNYPAVSSRDVKRIEIPCPPTVEEQTAIATVLSDMDAETTALQRRLDKTRAIKQGMMQQLLTGRVRLVEPTPVEAGP